jgi:hypothetical protein
MNIRETDIPALAPDALSWSSALELAQCNDYFHLGRDMENTMLFGEYSGSQGSTYAVSIDFGNPDSPVFQCSCPSRKNPCKHTLGLLILNARGVDFAVSEIPYTVLKQRKNAAAAKKKADSTRRRYAKTEPLTFQKHIQTRLEGLALSRELLFSLLNNGIGTVNGKKIHALQKQSKQLGNASLPGIQAAFLHVLDQFAAAGTESMYDDVCDAVIRFDALTRHGMSYLQNLSDATAENTGIDTEMESLLGTVWKLADLKKMGMVAENARLIQLAFTGFDNELTAQYEDIGVWAEADSGRLSLHIKYRPYKAVRHIEKDDTVLKAVCVPELCRYPSKNMNARIRWDGGAVLSEITNADRDKLIQSAARDYETVMTMAKTQIRNPLCDPNPYILVTFQTIGTAEGKLVLENESGQRLPMVNDESGKWPETLPVLTLLGERLSLFSAVLLRFVYINQSVSAVPLTLVGKNEILRLAY